MSEYLGVRVRLTSLTVRERNKVMANYVCMVIDRVRR